MLILITHVMRYSHIHGVGVLARKRHGHSMPMKTWRVMENSKYLGKVDSSQSIFSRWVRAKALEILILGFGVSHDTSLPNSTAL